MREQEFAPPLSQSSDSDGIDAELSRLEEQAASSDDEQSREGKFNQLTGTEKT